VWGAALSISSLLRVLRTHVVSAVLPRLRAAGLAASIFHFGDGKGIDGAMAALGWPYMHVGQNSGRPWSPFHTSFEWPGAMGRINSTDR
jgi:hypothetical protein